MIATTVVTFPAWYAALVGLGIGVGCSWWTDRRMKRYFTKGQRAVEKEMARRAAADETKPPKSYGGSQ